MGRKDVVLHPGQQVAWESDRRFVALIAGTGGGKALGVDTPVPTPSGFVKMGSIEVGDLVFTPYGRSTRVTYVSPIYAHNKCYRVSFDDGSCLVADADHRWWTQTANDRKNAARSINKNWEGSVKTTEEIAGTLMAGCRTNHSIDLPAPVEYSNKQLPIPPYTLGAWLGDGTSTCADITSADDEVLEEIRKEGVRVGVGRDTNSGAAHGYRLGGSKIRGGNEHVITHGRNTLQGMLRSLGLLGNKHIPDNYLMGSVAQRHALLAGLLDTDGYCAADGEIVFTSKLEGLAKQVLLLTRSLGIKCRIRIKKVNGGVYYDVHFTTDISVFKLRRKLLRQSSQCDPRVRRLFITKVEEIPPEKVRCI